jgi:outer membrane autotransporter protein
MQTKRLAAGVVRAAFPVENSATISNAMDCVPSTRFTARVVAPTVACLVVLFALDGARAQVSLNQALETFIDNDCPTVNGTGGNVDGNGPFGSNLNAICTFPGNGSPSSSGGTAGASSSTGPEKRRVERLHDDTAQPSMSDDNTTEMSFENINVFITGTYESEEKEGNPFEDGHDADRFGVTAGIDTMISDRALIGVALGLDHKDGEFDSGGDFQTTGYRATLFGSFLPADPAFVDLYAGFEWRDMEITRRVNFVFSENNIPQPPVVGNADGDPDGYRFAAGVAGGYDFSFDNVTLGPRVAFDYQHTKIDGYGENGTTGLEFSYDDFTEDSLLGKFGAQASVAISTEFGVVVPQANAYFVHEFQMDQQDLVATLVEDGTDTPLIYNNEEPDRNYGEFGVGIVAVFPGNLQAFLNYSTTQFNDNLENHVVDLGIRFAW